MDKLREADAIVDSLGKAMQSGETGLRYVPALLVRVINEEMWCERVIIKTGERVTFRRFLDFVTTDPLEGLGADMATLRRLCGDNPAALDALDRATQRGEGRPAETLYIVQDLDIAPTGNTAASALRRLRKAAPELHERVLTGDLSPHAAMLEAGFRRKTMQLPTDPEGVARALLRKFTHEDLRRIVELIADGIGLA